MPTTDAIIRAIVGRDATRVQPSGAHAANLLGLSEQVPLRLVFLTDGRGRTVSVGQRRIILKHAAPRQMSTAGRKSGTIIQALRWLGKRNVSQKTISKLRRQLVSNDHRDLLRSTRYAPAWIASILREIARDGPA